MQHIFLACAVSLYTVCSSNKLAITILCLTHTYPILTRVIITIIRFEEMIDSFATKSQMPTRPWVTRGRVYTFSLTVVICDTFGWRSVDAKSASRRLCALPSRYSFANTHSPPWLGRQCVLISRGYTRASSLLSCNMCA